MKKIISFLKGVYLVIFILSLAILTVSLLFYIINDFSLKTFLLYFIGIWFCIAIGFDGFGKLSVIYPRLKTSESFNHLFTIFSAMICFVLANIYFLLAMKNYYIWYYSVNALFTAAISLGGAIRLRYHPMCKNISPKNTKDG